MAQYVHHNTWRDALNKQERRARMPQAVKVQRRESCRLEQRLCLAIEAAAIEGLAVARCEHEAIILPATACGEPRFQLPRPMWTAEMGRLVAGVEVVIKNAAAGDGHTDRVLRLKHWDKLRALELWGKYRTLLAERREIDQRITLVDAIKGTLVREVSGADASLMTTSAAPALPPADDAR